MEIINTSEDLNHFRNNENKQNVQKKFIILVTSKMFQISNFFPIKIMEKKCGTNKCERLKFCEIKLRKGQIRIN